MICCSKWLQSLWYLEACQSPLLEGLLRIWSDRVVRSEVCMTIHKVHKQSNPQCDVPLSDHFGTYGSWFVLTIRYYKHVRPYTHICTCTPLCFVLFYFFKVCSSDIGMGGKRIVGWFSRAEGCKLNSCGWEVRPLVVASETIINQLVCKRCFTCNRMTVR